MSSSSPLVKETSETFFTSSSSGIYSDSMLSRSSLGFLSPKWSAKDSSPKQNITVKPSSNLYGVMKFRLPLIMKDPVLMNIPVGGVLETYYACTQYTCASTLLSQQGEWHISKVAASIRVNWGTGFPEGFFRITTAAPCNSLCMNKSFLSMYFLTNASFCCAFLPPITR